MVEYKIESCNQIIGFDNSNVVGEQYIPECSPPDLKPEIIKSVNTLYHSLNIRREANSIVNQVSILLDFVNYFDNEAKELIGKA